jgi:glycosyltransferase involved in cell wall biosynthesis
MSATPSPDPRGPTSEARGPRPEARLRVALVHDWLTGMRGGEKVLDAVCELFPEAPLFTLVHVKGSVSPRIESRRITTSFAQLLPGVKRFYRQYLPLYPGLTEAFDLDAYDLVISSSHCAVKSVVAAGAVHVCYCHSPMRYAWDRFDEYFGPARVGPTTSRAARPIMAALARWDAATAYRPHRFLANSQYVAGRIRRYYNRRSTVVYPPVDTDFYRPAEDADVSVRPAANFLAVSALVPYKRLAVAVDACRKVRVPLRIAGTGPELPRLQQLGGDGVAFLGWRSDEEIRRLYREATAVLLPGVEDFGMVPVEAQACGTPVVALDAGGARETVIDGQTGFLAADPSVDAFADALKRALQTRLDPAALRTHALRFSRPRFLAEFAAAVNDAVSNRVDPTGYFEPSAARVPPGDNPALSAARWPPGRDSAPSAARWPPGRDPAPSAARWPPGRDPAPRENEK